MSMVAVASAKGSPGATTFCLALALASRSNVDRLILEADGDGGTFAARISLGYEPGLVELAAACRREPPDRATVWRFAQTVSNGIDVVPAPASAEQSGAALTASAAPLALGLASLVDVECFVDLGRVSARSPGLELARHADLMLVVTRLGLHDVQHLPSRLETLRRVGTPVELVCVGTSPYDPLDVSDHLGVPLFGVWVDDVDAAEELWELGSASRRLRRSLWWRSTIDLAERLSERRPAEPSSPPAGADPVGEGSRWRA